MQEQSFCVYLMSNPGRTVLYTGVTRNLIKRVWQHKEKVADGFTKKYNVTDMVYYEILDSPIEAIEREKQIKSWSRKRKNRLVEAENSSWKDLYDEIVSW
ncbi:GIY-YIG nuclease family protein [Candidatus Collierbacteria bacterium]|nr:GIY-YIG nuclease family protein [Candidatus Collierbacteria bacterium]